MTTLISKLLPLFVTSDKGQVHQVDILSSLGERAPSSSSASSLSEPSSFSSSEASGDGEEATVKPPITACHRMIWPTRVFTWHNSSLKVSRWAEVDGPVEAGGAADYVGGCLGLSWAALWLIVVVFMAPITEKWGDMGKETEKGWRICVIAKGKMSLSRVTVSL